jgi:hypothetical protein
MGHNADPLVQAIAEYRATIYWISDQGQAGLPDRPPTKCGPGPLRLEADQGKKRSRLSLGPESKLALKEPRRGKGYSVKAQVGAFVVRAAQPRDLRTEHLGPAGTVRVCEAWTDRFHGGEAFRPKAGILGRAPKLSRKRRAD